MQGLPRTSRNYTAVYAFQMLHALCYTSQVMITTCHLIVEYVKYRDKETMMCLFSHMQPVQNQRLKE